MIVQFFSHVFEFTAVEKLSLNDLPDLCDELTGPFGSHCFASGVSEIHLLCTYEGSRNET